MIGRTEREIRANRFARRFRDDLLDADWSNPELAGRVLYDFCLDWVCFRRQQGLELDLVSLLERAERREADDSASSVDEAG